MTIVIRMVNTLKGVAKLVRDAMAEDARAEGKDGRED